MFTVRSTLILSSFYSSNRLGLSLWDPYAVHRGGCPELYYCNMVEWFWWDSRLISTTNWFPSVLWHCWFGHLACKNHPWNDLLCVEWDVKPLRYYYYYYHSLHRLYNNKQKFLKNAQLTKNNRHKGALNVEEKRFEWVSEAVQSYWWVSQLRCQTFPSCWSWSVECLGPNFCVWVLWTTTWLSSADRSCDRPETEAVGRQNLERYSGAWSWRHLYVSLSPPKTLKQVPFLPSLSSHSLPCLR